MEETISTPVETVDTADTSDVVETTTEPVEQTETAEITEDNGEQEVVEEKLLAGKYKSVEELEKGYKEAEKSFNRVAELEKQVQELQSKQPKIVDNGKINADFERRYYAQVDNEEFIAYDQLARQLEPETRATVEHLLSEAKALYNPNNKNAYEQKLNEIKNYFDSSWVEKISLGKAQLKSRVKQEFDNAIKKDLSQRAEVMANQIKEIPELETLVVEESENFSPEVLTIVSQLFNSANGLNLELTTKAINSIKALGVKEHLAKEKAKEVTDNATVPTSQGVVKQTSSSLPTYQELIENPEIYKKAVKKYGTDKIDEIIMKG